MKLFIRQLCAWAPGLDTDEKWRLWASDLMPLTVGTQPPAALVPAMSRRRLTLWGRMALEVACSCVSKIDENTPCIFASRHGDTERTFKLLQTMAESEPLSPTAFSLSVHNSSAGIFSIVQKIVARSVSLAAGKETFGQALVEAHGLLSQGYDKVLLVQVDEPISAFYSKDTDEDEIPYAFAMVIGGTEGDLLEFEYTSRQDTEEPSSCSMGVSFLRYWFSNSLGSEREMSYISKRSRWKMSKIE